MKRWGLVVTLFYAVVLVVLLLPGTWILATVPDRSGPGEAYLAFFTEVEPDWLLFLWLAVLVAGQALLLFLSVDTAWRKNRPRTRLTTTVALGAMLTALLFVAAVASLFAVVYGDQLGQSPGVPSTQYGVVAWWLGAWLFWAALFLGYAQAAPPVETAVRWLLRGSVLELLVAVTAHVVVRQRGDCSAPILTGFGIVTGIAVALLCFGPAVLALLARRTAGYRRAHSQR